MTEQGFSLIEVLVALAVSAMLSIAGGMILNQVLAASEAARVSANNNQSLASAYAVMKRDFRSALPQGAAPSTRAIQVQRTAKGWRASMVAGGFENPGEMFERGDVQFVEYRCADGEFVRAIWPGAFPQSENPLRRETLLSGIEDCRLQVAVNAADLKDIPNMPAKLDATLIDFEFDRGARGVVNIVLGAAG